MIPLKPMLPLRHTLEQHAPDTAASHTNKGPHDNNKQQNDWPQTERRTTNRRQQDRRGVQSAILLNTRKAQGRRKTSGRRANDLSASGTALLGISVKG
ncbi:hypothetical protein [Undibacterium curvum]|uniref:Uncharacterized protein n=1 Tax=Undibacterium curvum TaxID=2762294 RepID=A0ABR7A1N3_9BURK|nr:hypothetical protein [Undibacterium curvum]MBC3930826.1 hypothetical protein [Undibacterium curvum]